MNNLALKIYKMVIKRFLVEDKLRQRRFFEETILWVDISIETVLRMLFLLLSHIDLDFKKAIKRLT